MSKLDLSRSLPQCYMASRTPAIVEIPDSKFVVVDGQGDPSSRQFQEKIEAIYTVSYAAKFISKAGGNDYIVPKLEALWWFDFEKYQVKTLHEAPGLVPRSEWRYKLMLRLPDFIDKVVIDEAKERAFKKKGSVVSDISFLEYGEGMCVQILHIGPFEEEHNSLRLLQEFMASHSLRHNGHHHEVYLSDFRKTAPDKLKTILREPVGKQNTDNSPVSK